MRFAAKNGIRKSNDWTEKGFWREKVWFVLKHILESRTQKTQGNNNNYLFLKELFINKFWFVLVHEPLIK